MGTQELSILVTTTLGEITPPQHTHLWPGKLPMRATCGCSPDGLKKRQFLFSAVLHPLLITRLRLLLLRPRFFLSPD